MTTITLTGDYGYTPYYVSGLSSGSIIDATNASWIVANQGSEINRYPIRVVSSPDVKLLGGEIWGTISQTEEWEDLYINSAGIRIEYTANPIINDWRIDKAWDGIRIGPGTTNFQINDLYISNTRDDAIENDYMASGTIRDSLFDGVFVGIALDSNESVVGSNHDMSMNTMTLENTLIRLESYLYHGEMTHGPIIKSEDDNPQYSLNLRFINTVLAIEDIGHNGYARTATAWKNTVEVQNSYYLNLSDTPLPSNYPMPPAGFTVLQGAEARAYWETAKAAWLDNHDGTPTPLPTEITPDPTNNIINGNSNSNTLVGTDGVDEINGYKGADKLLGKLGSDILTGGLGKDRFIFDTPIGTDVDTITDFQDNIDMIYLDNAIFTQLGSGKMSRPGRIDSSWFDDVANDSNDYLLYNDSTGALSYDVDGNGSNVPIKIAQLTPGSGLDYNDIFIV